ncbi:MAG: hypothetical protein ABFS56_33120 [Pseudomonadota bacterium]
MYITVLDTNNQTRPPLENPRARSPRFILAEIFVGWILQGLHLGVNRITHRAYKNIDA